MTLVELSSGTARALYCKVAVRGPNSGIEKWGLWKGTIFTASFLR